MQGPDHTQVREMIGAPVSHSSCIVPLSYSDIVRHHRSAQNRAHEIFPQ